MKQTNPIAETANYIVLDQYERLTQINGSYQSEAQLEEELISDLQCQGYKYAPEIRTPEALLKNVRAKFFLSKSRIFFMCPSSKMKS